MSTRTVTSRARRFVATGAVWFVLAQGAVVFAVPRRVQVVLGLYGFVLHTVFGKAYTLVPSYFARKLQIPWAPAVHLPLAVAGTAALALESAGLASPPVALGGALAYLLVVSALTVATVLSIPVVGRLAPPRVTHLLVAGAATVLLLAVGFRLLPRFFVAEVPEALAAVVLATGALAPALLAISL